VAAQARVDVLELQRDGAASDEGVELDEGHELDLGEAVVPAAGDDLPQEVDGGLQVAESGAGLGEVAVALRLLGPQGADAGEDGAREVGAVGLQQAVAEDAQDGGAVELHLGEVGEDAQAESRLVAREAEVGDVEEEGGAAGVPQALEVVVREELVVVGVAQAIEVGGVGAPLLQLDGGAGRGTVAAVAAVPAGAADLGLADHEVVGPRHVGRRLGQARRCGRGGDGRSGTRGRGRRRGGGGRGGGGRGRSARAGARARGQAVEHVAAATAAPAGLRGRGRCGLEVPRPPGEVFVVHAADVGEALAGAALVALAGVCPQLLPRGAQLGGRGDVVFGVVVGGLEDDEGGVVGDDAEVATDARELGLVGAGLGLEAGDLEGGPGPGRELAGLVVGAQVEGDAADTGGVVGEAEVGDQGGEAAAKDPGEDHARAGQRGGGLGVDLGELVGIAGDRQEALGLDGEQGGGLLGAVGEEVEVLAAAAPGDAAQARGVGPQARDDGVDRCTPAVRAVIVGAVVEQAVAA
jgi:hypothetical protein